MTDFSNITSEQELLQLRNEGKITDEEYQQLQAAMRSNQQGEAQTPEPAPKEQKSKPKLAITGFCIMLAGFTLPFMFWYFAEYLAQQHHPNSHAVIAPWFFMGILFEITALTIGIIAWPHRLAKATVITLCIVIVLGILACPFLFSHQSYSVQENNTAPVQQKSSSG